MASREWNNLSPKNSDNINQGAAKIRETRVDIDERLQVDHINAVSVATDGYHKKTTLSNQGSRPATLTNYSILWAEDSGGVSQPYMKDGAGNVRQLGVPVGTICAYLPGYFTAAGNVGYTGVTMTLPDGWVLCDGSAPNDADSPIWNLAARYVPDLDDSRFLCGDTAGNRGTAGGYNTQTATYPNHTHTIGNHTITVNNASLSAHSITQPTFTHDHNHEWYKTSAAGYSYTWDAYYTQRPIGRTAGAGSTAAYWNIGSFEMYAIGASQVFNTNHPNSTACTRTIDVAIANHSAHTHVASASAHSVTSSGGGSVTISNSGDNRPQYLNVSYIIKIK